jgi:hypothetical protein
VPCFQIYLGHRIMELTGIWWFRGLDKILGKTGFRRFLCVFAVEDCRKKNFDKGLTNA